MNLEKTKKTPLSWKILKSKYDNKNYEKYQIFKLKNAFET